jgi:RNA polymerase sigma-70 factor, ECF subfamily
MSEGSRKEPLDWSTLIREHGSALILYARQWTDSHAEAEEAVQNAFVKFWNSRYRDVAGPLPLLYTAVRQCALDASRSRLRRTERERKASEEAEDGPRMFQPDFESEEQRKIIEVAIQGLPPEQREVLVMKVWGDLTFQQIGESLGIPLNTAASRYRYALAALRQALGKDRESV